MRVYAMRTWLLVLLFAVLLALPSSAELVVLTDTFGLRGSDTTWPEHLGAEVLGNPGMSAWRMDYLMTYYPNRFDLTGDTVILALGYDDARRRKPPDIFAWQSSITSIVARAYALGAAMVVVPYLPEAPALQWTLGFYNWGYRSLCAATILPENHPRAPDRDIRCGLLARDFDFFGDNDTWMNDAGHEEFARLVGERLDWTW